MQYTYLINNLTKINNQLTQYNNSSKSNILNTLDH